MKMRRSHRMLIILFTILVIVSCIRNVHCDTSDDHEDIVSPAESAIFKMHELISQESALRLTLDKQIQDLRTMLYQLKSEQEKTIPKIDMVNNMIANMSENLRQNYLTVQSADHKMNTSFKDLSTLVEDKLKNMEQTNTELAMNISSVQERLSRKMQDKSPVYFSVSLSAPAITTKKANEILIFDNVIANKGNGYILSNGTFICPRNGTYLIAFGLLNQLSKSIHFNLLINGNVAIRAFAYGNHAWSSAEKVTITTLNHGDQVNIQVQESGAKVYGHHYSTFAATYIRE